MSANAKHTPGPWKVERGNQAIYVSAEGGAVARVFPSDLSDDGNAQLIAAAPELLEALEAMREFCDSNDWGSVPRHLERSIRDALAKAKGEQ